MLAHRIIPIRAFTDNLIWMILNESTQKICIVDPGDATPVIDAIDKNHFKLAAILLTHHHHDHSGGIERLVQLYKNTPVIGSHKSSIQAITHPVKEGDKFSFDGFSLNVLEIPGHTLDHIAFFNDDILLSGDTLFSAGCGKMFEGTYTEMYDSLEKLKSLPLNTKMYCGHEYTLANLNFAHHIEPHNKNILDKLAQVKDLLSKNQFTLPSLLGEERIINPFLRCDEPQMINLIESHIQKKITHPATAFAHLREWKNKFRI